MKVILVPVADRPECKIALHQAFKLADRLSSNIVGCHLREHRAGKTAKQLLRPRIALEGSTGVVARTSKRSGEMGRKSAKKLFLSLADKYNFELSQRPRLGVTHDAQWLEMVGDFDKLFSIVGPVCDLSVVSRPNLSAKGRSTDFMLAALFQPDRPTLIVPQKPVAQVGQHVLIAWDQSVKAARAVSAALPLLTQAEAVHIHSCGPENRVGPKSTALARYLTYWGVKTTRSKSKGLNPSQELISAYNKNNADLMVMGANSRSRMRQFLFGGVTQHMLFEATIPVFALHS